MNSTIIQCPACGVKNRIPADKLHLTPVCGKCRHSLRGVGAGKAVELDDTAFDKVIGNPAIPVLVDFYSPTCGPCQMLAPVIDALAEKYAGRVVIAKYNTSRFQQAAARFQIRGVPTLIFFKLGKVADQLVRAAPQADIEQRLNSLL